MKKIVNIINFVRGVEPRPGHVVDLHNPVREQMRIMRELGLKGTFLLQYDALYDEEILQIVKAAPSGVELGLWLEVVQPQVEAIGLQWRGRYPWDWHNDVGFLIGYVPDERKKLIDEHIRKFEEIFGYYPKAVGSWHIDAVSLKYLSEQYEIDASCICREQVGTDGYTLQGGYYNQAYYPGVYNMFAPAQTKENQINLPVFRMLGSCPAFAYDYQLADYDGIPKIPTLEPAQLAFENEWSDFLLEEIFDGNGLNFQYTQIGQENSFGWKRMKEGIEFQFAKVAKIKEQGQVEVLTLGETGSWFKKTFDMTPPTTYVADRRWMGNDVKSFWYNSKHYRINLFMNDGILRVRDLYIFDEKYEEKYLTQRCEILACEYRNLPVIDGVLYSNKEKGLKAGCYFCQGNKPIAWNIADYAENGQTAHLTLEADCGKLEIALLEKRLELHTNINDFKIVAVYDKDNVYGGQGDNDKAFANSNGKATLSYISKAVCSENKAVFVFNEFEYALEVEKGVLDKAFSLSPTDGDIVISLCQLP